MVSTRRVVAGLGLAAAFVFVLTGCATNPAGGEAGDSRLRVLTSTNVYGQIADEIGGELVEVTSLITSASQDPHAYEASARDQLSVSRADLLVDNGGGYDPFIDALIAASGSKAPLITAVDFSPAHSNHGEGFNEHVWYDPATMAAVADAIADELSALDPGGAGTFTANAEDFGGQIDSLKEALDALATDFSGTRIFVTEPVPLFLTDAAGLENVTPTAFSEAVEEGQDVPPAALLESLSLLSSGDVRIVIVNAQTGGAETTRIVDEAERLGIPVLDFSETLPPNTTFVQWMQRNIDELGGALTA